VRERERERGERGERERARRTVADTKFLGTWSVYQTAQ